MLHLQKYLLAGRTLEELQSEHHIKTSPCPALGVVAFNYDQIYADMRSPIARECRGLILSEDFKEVKCRSFDKFFNLGQPEGEDLEVAFDFQSLSVQDKLDGTLINFWHDRGQWNIATRGRADASGTVGSDTLTFDALTRHTLTDMGLMFDSFTAALNPDTFYSFELTTPLNMVIVRHSDYRLTWLAAWQRSNLAELDIRYMSDIGVGRVGLRPLKTFADAKEWVESQPATECEGVILKDGAGRRLKVKSAAYFLSARAVSLSTTPKQQLELLLSGSADDVYPLLPKFAQEQMDALKDKLVHLRGVVEGCFAAISPLPTQKEFALEAVKKPFSGLLFEMRKGLTWEQSLAKSRAENLLLILEKSNIFLF